MILLRKYVVFVFAALLQVGHARGQTLDLDAIESQVEAMRAELPFRGDASTEIVGIVFDRESLSIVFVQIVDLRVDPAELLKMLGVIKVPHICEEYRDVISQGLSLVYVSKARDGRDIGAIRAGQTECGFTETGTNR